MYNLLYMIKRNKKFFTGFVLVVFAVLSRTLIHIGDNIEFVTTASLLAGVYLGLIYSLAVPLAVMMITDMILGNTSIFLFTWSGFFFIGILGYLSTKGKLGVFFTKKGSKAVRPFFLAVISSLFFYFWTNFGVWSLDVWGMYPKNFQGLVDCYILGLPFLKSNLTGNLFFVPLSFFTIEIASQKKNLLSPVKFLRRIYNRSV